MPSWRVKVKVDIHWNQKSLMFSWQLGFISLISLSVFVDVIHKRFLGKFSNLTFLFEGCFNPEPLAHVDRDHDGTWSRDAIPCWEAVRTRFNGSPFAEEMVWEVPRAKRGSSVSVRLFVVATQVEGILIWVDKCSWLLNFHSKGITVSPWFIGGYWWLRLSSKTPGIGGIAPRIHDHQRLIPTNGIWVDRLHQTQLVPYQNQKETWISLPPRHLDSA